MNRSTYGWVNRGLAGVFLLILAAPLPLRVSADGGRVLLPGGVALPELCMYKRATGLDCKSCHIGRSLILAAHGDLEGSVSRHRGGVILYGWVVVQAAARLILSFGGLALARFWWLDLSLSLGSLTAASGAVIWIGR